MLDKLKGLFEGKKAFVIGAAIGAVILLGVLLYAGVDVTGVVE